MISLFCTFVVVFPTKPVVSAACVLAVTYAPRRALALQCLDNALVRYAISNVILPDTENALPPIEIHGCTGSFC